MELSTSDSEGDFDNMNGNFWRIDIAEWLLFPFGYHSFVYFEHRLTRHIQLQAMDDNFVNSLQMRELMVFGNGEFTVVIIQCSSFISTLDISTSWLSQHH